MRLVTHGRFPMSKQGIAQIIDWEFDGDKPRARMLVNGKQRFVMQRGADMNGDGLADMVASPSATATWAWRESLLAIFYQTPEYRKLWADGAGRDPARRAARGAA